MRKVVAALVVAALALAVAGCSSPPAATTTPAPAPAPAPAAAAPAGGSAQTTSLSTTETAVFVPFPTGPDVPADLAQKITTNKQPTLIFFYDSSQYTSQEVRKIIDSVRDDNRGLVDLVAYDIGKFTSAAGDGSIVVNDKLAGNDAAKQAALFARNPAIDASFTPFIVLTDGQGYIIYKHSGLVDPAFLEREVQRASR